MNCWSRVETSSSVCLSLLHVCGQFCEQRSDGEGRAGSLVVVCSSEPQLVSCCQSAPTVLCTGIWPLAAAGWTGLGLTENRATSVSVRDSDSSLSFSAWSLTF